MTQARAANATNGATRSAAVTPIRITSPTANPVNAV
jgi:hypothetical protein